MSQGPCQVLGYRNKRELQEGKGLSWFRGEADARLKPLKTRSSAPLVWGHP